MTNPFNPAPQVSGVSGSDGTYKDTFLHVGALRIGSTNLLEENLSTYLGGVGAVTTASTTAAEEYSDGVDHITKLTMTAFAVGLTANGVALASGAKFYTFPAGTIVVEDISLVGSLLAALTTKTDTPEIGIGSVIGSGAAATLSTTMEDYVDGGAAGYLSGVAIAPDVNGGYIAKGTDNTTPTVIKTSSGLSHDLFLNIADTWVAEAAAAVTFTGVITIRWRKIS
jgi:hypothetical protein